MTDDAAARLDDGVAAGAFPCAVAEAGAAAGPLWRHATGRLSSEPSSPAADANTIFDLASLTKVIATTTVAMRLVDTGALKLASPVHEHVQCWRDDDRRLVTVADLLEHASGLPDYRPLYQRLSGRAAFIDAICHEPLAYAPRSASVYSDLGFILLGGVIEAAGSGTLDHQFAAFWAEALPGVPAPIYAVPADRRSRVAPTGHDVWRGRLLQGEVHDGNACALGGVAPHSGLFGTATSVGAFARWMLRLLRGVHAPGGVSPETARRFAARGTVPGSSRALGWDTMLPTSSCGRRFSPAAIGHTGYTGTSLWLDPALDRYAVLLTNRVHAAGDHEAIQAVRPAFHDALLASLAP